MEDIDQLPRLHNPPLPVKKFGHGKSHPDVQSYARLTKFFPAISLATRGGEGIHRH